MHTDMIIRKKANRLWGIIGVCALGLYITACDNSEFPGDKKKTVGSELCFAVSISDSPSTRTAQGTGVLTGEAFPDGTHTFGMFITDGTGNQLAAGSNDNMKSILTQATGQDDIWAYTDKNDRTLSLKAKQGDEINVTGYYPWTSGATSTAVPFDLTGDVSVGKDLLYLSSPTSTQQVADGTPIALTFSHAYCWVTVKLSKLTDENDVLVRIISLENSYNTQGYTKIGIMNKGTVNPKTGDVIKDTSGPLTINCDPVIDIPLEETGGTPSEFDFLVPAFMSTDIKDSDLVLRVTTEDADGTRKVLSFPLAKAHLNADSDGKCGLRKGMHNTYNIVYNNSKMILSLSNWKEVSIGGSMGQGTVGETPVTVDYTAYAGFSATVLSAGNHIYHTYLGEVAEDNNGAYVDINTDFGSILFDAWRKVMKSEAAYPKVMVARNLAAGGAMVPWKNETTGVLTAKQACVEFRDGGYTDWRLPRIGELFACVYLPNDAIKQHSNDLWSATEYNAGTAYSTSNYGSDVSWIFSAKTPKAETLYVRCVRDADKPRPIL